MNVVLLKYHVLRCPKCGQLKCSTSHAKTRCVKCMHGWEIHKNGHTWGVLASFYTPAQASQFIRDYKMRMAKMRAQADDVRTAFSLLGLDENCSREEFISQYRKRAFMYHPDLNKGNIVAQEQFKDVTHAAHQIRSAMGWM